jgi:monoamine oxidase
LQAGSITFDPEPVSILRAARSLEVGHVFRVVFQFPEAFWADRFPATSFFVSTEKVFPTWWTPYPVITPILTGWSAGPAADPLQGKTKEAIINEALASLSRILARDIPTPIAAHFHDWSGDPFFRGAYSYVPVNASAARRSLARPVKDTLFFAGEATNTEGHGGTVHGAIATGRRAAKQILRATRSL